jgi:hypothetical protein
VFQEEEGRSDFSFPEQRRRRGWFLLIRGVPKKTSISGFWPQSRAYLGFAIWIPIILVKNYDKSN